jgi:FtsP/CotA-like multicopper oxidase with cupredoxin domain
MAAIAIPLIAEFAPKLIDLIASLVHRSAPAAEAKYGPKSGPVKFAEVFATVMADLQKAIASGSIGKELPGEEAIKAIIQSAVATLDLTGSLNGGALVVSASPSTTPGPAITLQPGQTITITITGG